MGKAFHTGSGFWSNTCFHWVYLSSNFLYDVRRYSCWRHGIFWAISTSYQAFGSLYSWFVQGSYHSGCGKASWSWLEDSKKCNILEMCLHSTKWKIIENNHNVLFKLRMAWERNLNPSRYKICYFWTCQGQVNQPSADPWQVYCTFSDLLEKCKHQAKTVHMNIYLNGFEKNLIGVF